MNIQNLGLNSKDAEKLLNQYGLNQLEGESKFNILKVFLSQFNNFLIVILIIASIISLLLGEQLDSILIFSIVLMNAFFGFYQEFKAEKSLSLLKSWLKSMVRVKRDGSEIEIEAKFLVPGDLIFLEEGSKIPADGKIIKSNHFEVNEASITGESLPVPKREGDKKTEKVLTGTVVSAGSAYVLIQKTGKDTYFGKISTGLKEIKQAKTPLQKKLEQFAKVLGVLGIIISLVVFWLSYLKTSNLFESFLMSVSVAVAAIPEGLPAVMTVILSIGVLQMSKKKAIVRKLDSIEAMGSLNLIATDKTGTLTTNQMRVKEIWHRGKLALDKILLTSSLCSTASLVKKENNDFDVLGDTTEGALLIMNEKYGKMSYEQKRSEWQKVEEISFSPLTKRMTVVAVHGQEKLVLSKGSPESILSICTHILVGNTKKPLNEKMKQLIQKQLNNFAKKGLRVIAFSNKEHKSGNLEKNQCFLGFVGIADPLRKEIPSAVSMSHKMGVDVVMITGDGPITAEVIAREAGILKKGDEILSGDEIRNYSDEDLLRVLPRVKVFARVFPEDKLRIVSLFQKMGKVVAVTGDGVNDCLALKKADVGLSMGLTGTDVAKDVSHIVLTDDNFATLVDAVLEGRNIFIRIKHAIKYLLSCNIGEVFYVILSLSFNLPLLTPIQLLYINVVTDGLPAISFAFSPGLGKGDKIERGGSFLNKADGFYLFAIGIIGMALAGIMGLLGKNISYIFTIVVFFQHFILLDLFIGRRKFSKSIKYLLSPVFVVAFIFPLILHPLIIYNPLLQKAFGLVHISPIGLVEVLIYSFIAFLAARLLGQIKNRLKYNLSL
jgi:Ca2+-transporting ATPase